PRPRRGRRPVRPADRLVRRRPLAAATAAGGRAAVLAVVGPARDAVPARGAGRVRRVRGGLPGCVADAPAPAAGDQVLPGPVAVAGAEPGEEQPGAADAGRRPRVGPRRAALRLRPRPRDAVPRLRVRPRRRPDEAGGAPPGRAGP